MSYGASATVARIRGKPRPASGDLRRHQGTVREAARASGYVPNGIARALREGSARTVTLTIDAALEGNCAV